MIKKSHAFISIAAGLCLSMLFLSGCTTAGRATREPDDFGVPRQQRFMQRNDVGNVNPPDTRFGFLGGNFNRSLLDNGKYVAPQKLRNNQPDQANRQNQPDMTAERQKSENIRRELARLNGIDNVNVVVVGDTALVAYDSAKAGKNIAETKKMIVNKVKQMDKNIKTVAVSESPDFMQGVQKISNDITNGRPLDQVTDQVKQMINKAAPVVQ